jgi:hypothetical protein
MFYRGVVEEDKDPLGMGRLKVRVIGLYDGYKTEDLPWAYPAFPIGGSSGYGFWMIPKKGDTVWVTFEGNYNLKPDTSKPVWIGTWFGKGEPSAEMKNNKQFLVKTPAGNVIHISDDEDFIEVRDRKNNIIKIDISSDTVLIKTANKVLIEAETEVSVKAGRINLNP